MTIINRINKLNRLRKRMITRKELSEHWHDLITEYNNKIQSKYSKIGLLCNDDIQFMLNYNEAIPGAIKDAASGKDCTKWDRRNLDFFLYSDKYDTYTFEVIDKFDQNQKDAIEKHWKDIAPLLQTISKSQNVQQFNVYNDLKMTIDNILKQSTSNYVQKTDAISKLIACLQPYLFSTIVSKPIFDDFCNLLIEYCTTELPMLKGDIVQDNIILFKWFVDNLDGKYILETIKLFPGLHGTSKKDFGQLSLLIYYGAWPIQLYRYLNGDISGCLTWPKTK